MEDEKTIQEMSPTELEAHVKQLNARNDTINAAIDAETDEDTLQGLRSELDQLHDTIVEAENRLENDLFCSIDGEIYEVSTVKTGGYLPWLGCGSTEFAVASSSSEAGEKAREYWEEMAQDDPEEFACMVGTETLVRWGMGHYAGPGSTQVSSLEEWLDLWLDTPEEQWASYDSTEREVDWVSPALDTELGYTPEVAYRQN